MDGLKYDGTLCKDDAVLATTEVPSIVLFAHQCSFQSYIQLPRAVYFLRLLLLIWESNVASKET